VTSALRGRRIGLAVCGGIAAYKAIECVRLLTEAGAEVRVLMTPEATRFVTPLTFEAISYHPVVCDWLVPGSGGETHIQLSEWMEVLAVVPATASMLARLALGLADDVVSGTALATRAPLLLAPAMNDRMYTHPQTQEHLRQLEGRGAAVVAPAVGRLASGKEGVGRLAHPERIVAAIAAVVNGRRNLVGLRVVVTAGGTREPVDPVRYVGNFSSGKMGKAMAEVAAARGARVTLISAGAEQLEGIDVVPVGTAEEMLAATKSAATDADVLVMAAAVADYRPAAVEAAKIRRRSESMDLKLLPTVDVLAGIGSRPGLFRVGFAAETEDLEAQARSKLEAKSLDLIVANQVGVDGQGLGSDFNAALVIGPQGAVIDDIPRLPKSEVAERIWDNIRSALDRRG
jgi:phosphopantothenoylcysteine decarboxylase/phosphopantothenate--cysteine ligase